MYSKMIAVDHVVAAEAGEEETEAAKAVTTAAEAAVAARRSPVQSLIKR